MAEPDLIQLFARPLHDAGWRYLIAGSVGAMAYSEPRMTIDVDIAVAIPTSELSQLVTIFPESEFYLPPLEVLMVENARECRAHFNVIHMKSGLKADFYPALRDPFFARAWQNRNEVSHESGALKWLFAIFSG